MDDLEDELAELVGDSGSDLVDEAASRVTAARDAAPMAG